MVNKTAILLSTFNGARYLDDQLESIINQSVDNWDLYIRDDGSIDETLEIIKYYCKKYTNMYLIEDDLGNLGPQRSFMHLLSRVDAEYYFFSDQDDIWVYNKIEITLKEISELEKKYPNEGVLFFSNLFLIDENNIQLPYSFWELRFINPILTESWKDILAYNIVTGCTIGINSHARKTILPFSIQNMMHDHWMAVILSKYGRICYSKIPLVKYRQHENNVAGIKRKVLNTRQLVNEIKNTIINCRKASLYFNEITFIGLLMRKLRIRFWRLMLRILS